MPTLEDVTMKSMDTSCNPCNPTFCNPNDCNPKDDCMPNECNPCLPDYE